MDEPDPAAPASRSDHASRPFPVPPTTHPDAGGDAPFASFDQVVRAYWSPLHDRLLRIENRLIERAAPFAQLEMVDAEPRTTIQELSNDLGQAMLQLQHRLDELRDDLRELRRTSAEAPPSSSGGRQPTDAASASAARLASTTPVAPSFAPSAAPGSTVSHMSHDDAWEALILGSELCGRPDLAAHRQRLLHDLHAGRGAQPSLAAQSLAGQLLLLHASNAEELPERLRYVGEAYYRWHPRTTTADDPLEAALAALLTSRAESVGLRNSIQLVRPGDRFDSTRHVTNGRGLEVVAVHGWIVLRENQKVYTKASVTVR